MEQGTVNILIPVIGAVIAFVSVLVTWYLNERSKRIYEEYKRKEEKYSGLIRNLKGFYDDSLNKELKTEFLNQLNLCWMYCPDEVIHKAYDFLRKVRTDQKHSDEEKEKAVEELMLAIRKDLISRKPLRKTSLRPEDFKHLRAT
jgi:Pyruvate/2-oxoacid:ferredoxin oxidoreductase delta subunit